MRRKRIFLLAPPAIVMIAVFMAIGGEVVLQLWNWLVPAVFGWRQITFWQALGLLALCRILFGGFGGRGLHGSSFRRRMDGRWEWMTPEEREKVRQVMRARCGFGASTTETKEPA
jgi:hypothetical protein